MDWKFLQSHGLFTFRYVVFAKECELEVPVQIPTKTCFVYYLFFLYNFNWHLLMIVFSCVLISGFAHFPAVFLRLPYYETQKSE